MKDKIWNIFLLIWLAISVVAFCEITLQRSDFVFWKEPLHTISTEEMKLQSPARVSCHWVTYPQDRKTKVHECMIAIGPYEHGVQTMMYVDTEGHDD